MVKTAHFPHYCTMSEDQAIVMLDMHYQDEMGWPPSVHHGYDHYSKMLEYANMQNSDCIDLSDNSRKRAVAKYHDMAVPELLEWAELAVRFGLFDAAIWREFQRLTSTRMVEVRKTIEAKSAAGRKGGKARKADA